MTSWKLTVEKTLSLSWGFCVGSARSSWFTCDKQGTLTLFFCVVKRLYKQFLIEIVVYIHIGSGAKIRKSVQNRLLTAFSTGKIKINHLGTWNIPIYWQTVDIFRPFSSPWEECFYWKHGTYMCFQENHKNLFFGEKWKK